MSRLSNELHDAPPAVQQDRIPDDGCAKGSPRYLSQSDVPPVVLAHITGIHIRTAILWRDAMATSRARHVNELLIDGGATAL
jgi:hypothetical protein